MGFGQVVLSNSTAWLVFKCCTVRGQKFYLNNIYAISISPFQAQNRYMIVCILTGIYKDGPVMPSQ